MNCNCFEEANISLRKATGDPEAYVRGVFRLIGSSLIFTPSVEIIYRNKKKDGTFNVRPTSMELTYTYCPFCGKKLEDDPEKGSVNEN